MNLQLDRFGQLNENRKLAKPPEFHFTVSAIQKYPAAYTKYFNDHFGFRKWLVTGNFLLKHQLLGVSPSSQVIVGKDGWLFYTGEGEVNDSRAITRFEGERLEHWARSLEMKRVWLEKQGIHYLFVIAPNKSTVYREFMPDSHNRVREKTGIDDLIDYLRANTRVAVVDVRPALQAAKTTERLYHRTDTHWNDYGAFIAYQEIMKQLVRWYPSLKMHTLDEFEVSRSVGAGADLAGLIGGSDHLAEEYVKLRPRGKYSLPLAEINDEAKSPVSVEHAGTAPLRALFFRDSFFSWVTPFLADHFAYSCYYWKYWNSATPIEEMLAVTRPNIVIEEIAERRLTSGMADFVGAPPAWRAP